ncbi:MAG: hypothetical protein HEQ40_12730 [Lacibacter sp.]|jgi:hypothetical protein
MKLHFYPFVLATICCVFTGCISTQKIDAFIAEQYGNQLPRLNKKNATNITVNSQLAKNSDAISVTTNKTSNFLPLIVYWHYDYRRISQLHPDIAVHQFTNALNNAAAKPLQQKLEGKKLELTVEQAPVSFAQTEKTNVIFVLYLISWSKFYMEPDFIDLVVSYQLTNADGSLKTGKIQVANPMRNQKIRLFQKWKSAYSEFITEYNLAITTMTKSFAAELMKQL